MVLFFKPHPLILTLMAKMPIHSHLLITQSLFAPIPFKRDYLQCDYFGILQ